MEPSFIIPHELIDNSTYVESMAAASGFTTTTTTINAHVRQEHTFELHLDGATKIEVVKM